MEAIEVMVRSTAGPGGLGSRTDPHPLSPPLASDPLPHPSPAPSPLLVISFDNVQTGLRRTTSSSGKRRIC